MLIQGSIPAIGSSRQRGLEADLLDRLSSFLAASIHVTVEVERQIESVHKQQAESERRSTDWKSNCNPKGSGNTIQRKNTSSGKAHVPVFSVPQIGLRSFRRSRKMNSSSGTRGAWLQVGLEGGRSVIQIADQVHASAGIPDRQARPGSQPLLPLPSYARGFAFSVMGGAAVER